MVDQLEAPWRPGARLTDPDTSHEADEKQRQRFGKQAREVLAIVKRHPGRSSKHLATIIYAEYLNSEIRNDRLPMDRYAIARRLSDLREIGRAENRYHAELGHPDFGKICRSPTGILWWAS